MYAGRIVEHADTDTIFAAPEHPYTWGLLGSIPRLDSPRDEELVPIAGRPPSLINLPGGCSFHPRCPYVQPDHMKVDPALEPVPDDAEHRVACLLDRTDAQRSSGATCARASRRSRPAPHVHAGRRGGGLGASQATRRHRRPRRRSRPRRRRTQASMSETVTEPLRRRARRPRNGRAADGGPRPRQALPAHQRASSSSARSAPCRPSTASPSTCMRGETLGLVGESGCGKSTTARLLLRLMDPTVRLDPLRGPGDRRRLTARALKALRQDMQMIFQDPYSSLNPRKTVGTIIGEPFAIQGMHNGEGERKKTVQELMDIVGLNPEHYNRYPHEFSGGQRQRIGVARALALQAEADHRRRARLRARRLDPGADPQPAARPAARARDHARVHRARPLGRAPHVRPRGGHVPRPDRRDGDLRPALRAPAHALHGRADVGGAGRGPAAGRAEEAPGAGRRRAVADQPAAGLPLPHPLLEGAGDLPHRRPAAGAQGRRQRRRLPLPAHGRRGRRARPDVPAPCATPSGAGRHHHSPLSLEGAAPSAARTAWIAVLVGAVELPLELVEALARSRRCRSSYG